MTAKVSPISASMVEKPSPERVLTVSGPGRHNPPESFSSVRAYVAVFAFVAAALTVTSGQSPEADLRKQLARLFPEAASFSAKGGTPPHVKAFGPSATDKQAPLLGLAYWTTELEPLERGYDGPIKMLVGMDTKGILRGVIVTEHREPYGDFSVDRPEFAAQFRNKDIRDAFRVGADIDAVSRATITVTSASRAVRNSSRRIARALLTPPESSK